MKHEASASWFGTHFCHWLPNKYGGVITDDAQNPSPLEGNLSYNLEGILRLSRWCRILATNGIWVYLVD